MFQRELNLAVANGDRMLGDLGKTLGAPRIGSVSGHLRQTLEAAWRVESALGEFLAVEEEKLQAANMVDAAAAARRAFATLKPALADADEAHRRPEAQMKEWAAGFQAAAEGAVAAAREAQRLAPPPQAERITRPTAAPGVEGANAVVSIARTTERGLGVAEVERLVREALRPLGGISKFVSEGQTVLLKPNQTLFVLADEGSTTDPRLVAALVRLCYEAGAVKVIVGESSGGGSKSDYVMHVTGVKALAQRAGAEVVDFQICEQREVDVPQGKMIKRILLPAPLLDADVVINLPKMKTHNWDWMSGALKNWVGIVRPDVRSAHHDVHMFDEYVDLLFRVTPRLNVMDGIIRGVGNGPGANEPEFYGGILASTDPVALDVIAAQILGFDPAAIGFVRVASQRGLGEGDPSRIAVVGVPMERAFKPGKPPVMGVDMYDANVIVGTGLTRAGTLGHIKSMGDIFHAMGTWGVVRRLHGRPTLLIGDAEDPLFGEHLQEGPYVVIDDAAPDKYKHHPGVFFVPGHPVLHNLETELLTGLRIPRLGHVALGIMGQTRSVDSRIEYDSPRPLVPFVDAALQATRALPVAGQVALLVSGIGTVVLGTGLALWSLLAGRRSR